MTGIGIADVIMNNMTALRWFSTMNPAMDCVVYVPINKEDIAREKIQTAMDEWYEDGEDLAYGDAIKFALDAAGVPYVILLPEWDSDGKSCVAEWDEWADAQVKVSESIY